MIKMTNQTSQNDFRFFCDECSDEISKTNPGEVIFTDMCGDNKPIEIIICCQKCGDIVDKELDYKSGNVHLDELLNNLSESI